MRHRATAPRLTVVLAVEGAPEYLSRAIESVQAQDIHDIQFVIVQGDVAPGIEHSLDLVADRDIHVDLLKAEASGLSMCYETGFRAARGTYVAFMQPYDWYAPHALERCLEGGLEIDADIVFPGVSLDRYDVHRERHSRMVGKDSFAYKGYDELRSGVSHLIESGLVAQSTGVLFKRSVLDELQSLAVEPSRLSLVSEAYAVSGSVCSVPEAVFHTSAVRIVESFDPTMFSRACSDTKSLARLLKAFDLDDASEAAHAREQVFYSALVACIENLCLSPHSVSSIERNARLKDMLDASRTREMVAALKPHRRDLGLMFQPIAAAKPLSCIMRSHVADFLNLSMNKSV